METPNSQSTINISEVLCQLTEENQQQLLAVLETLYFAQNTQDVSVIETKNGLIKEL